MLSRLRWMSYCSFNTDSRFILKAKGPFVNLDLDSLLSVSDRCMVLVQIFQILDSSKFFGGSCCAKIVSEKVGQSRFRVDSIYYLWCQSPSVSKALNFWISDVFRIAFKSSLGPPRVRDTFSEPNRRPQTPDLLLRTLLPLLKQTRLLCHWKQYSTFPFQNKNQK